MVNTVTRLYLCPVSELISTADEKAKWGAKLILRWRSEPAPLQKGQWKTTTTSVSSSENQE